MYSELPTWQPKSTSQPWSLRALRPRKSDVRNADIYETAARLFYEKGYASTSLREIATTVGLQKGSLYHYISSKEDLLFEIIKYAHDFFMSLMKLNEQESGSPLSKLQRILFSHAWFAAEHFHVTAVFYNERSSLSPDRQAQIVESRDSYEHLLRQYVIAAQEVGEVADEIDPKLAVLSILGSINWIYTWYNPGGPLSPEMLADELSKLAVRALLP